MDGFFINDVSCFLRMPVRLEENTMQECFRVPSIGVN